MTTFLKDDFTGSGNISAHAVSGSGAVGGAWSRTQSHPANWRSLGFPADRRRDEPDCI